MTTQHSATVRLQVVHDCLRYLASLGYSLKRLRLYFLVNHRLNQQTSQSRAKLQGHDRHERPPLSHRFA